MDEDTQARTCILHVGNQNHKEVGDKILPFSDCTFLKARECATIRLKFKGVSKYKELARAFPHENEKTIGYHHKCYSNFTAIKKNELSQIGAESLRNEVVEAHPTTNTGEVKHHDTSHVTLRSSQNLMPSQRDRNILDQKCIFCHRAEKWTNRKRELLILGSTKQFEQGVRLDAHLLNDFKLLAAVGDRDFAASEVRYHNSCRKMYNRQAHQPKTTSTPIVKSLWHIGRDVHKEAFQSLEAFIKLNILEKEEIFLLNDLHKRYVALCQEKGLNDMSGFLIHHLEKKLADRFPKEIVFDRSNMRQGVLVLKAGMVWDQAARILFNQSLAQSQPLNAVKEVAYLLRKEILATEKKSINASSIDSILEGEAEPPTLLHNFFEALVGGPAFTSPSPGKLTRIKALSADTMFATTQGRVASGKHVSLGVAIKSLTGSKQLLQILNRFGYTINYSKAEEIETAIADSIASASSTVPDGISKTAGSSTFSAFDNYDEFCDTLTGQGSLHETVGICYQRAPQEATKNTTSDEFLPSQQRSSRKRSHEFLKVNLEHYHKKPRLNASFETKFTAEPPTYYKALIKDTFWFISVALGEGKCPMWTGYNSLTTKDNSPKHTVSYLRNYDETSTSPSMVLETLKVAQRVAEECNEPYAVVTYDLNIAKPAMQIKSEAAPRFDNVFVNFGSFHLYLAYFSALGKIITGSGGPEILADCGIIGPGSLKGFLGGRHYNRCKRIHPIFAAALQVCHLQLYEEMEGPIGEEVKQFISESLQNPHMLKDSDFELPREVAETIRSYELFVEKTSRGEHGVTAQFWMNYIGLVRDWFILNRAVKTNDVDLFVFILPKITNLFFATNHVNYARWMVAYHQQLLRLDSEYVGLREMIERDGGFFSIKRTEIPFSGTPVDQALEQTVNRDAASRLTGTSAFNTQPAARARWTVTRSARSRIVSAVKDMVHLDKKEDVSYQIRPSRVRKDHRDVIAIVKSLKDSLNPFSASMADDKLFNISTGKAVNAEITQYLLNVQSLGDSLRQDFLKACVQDPNQFDKPIKKQRILNFESNGVKFVAKSGSKVRELQMTTAIFGKLCCLAISKNVDMRLVLTFPLTPIPLSLANVDGSFNKTAKSQLLRHLEDTIIKNPTASPSSFSYVIIDGMFFLHTIPIRNIKTYGALSDFILKKVREFKGDRIDIVFDTYRRPSIKQTERVRREGHNQEGEQLPEAYLIKNPEQQCPKNFNKSLKNENFKVQLIQFLTEDWKNERHYSTADPQRIFIASGTSCYTFRDGQIEFIEELSCDHEEADTRMFLHYSLYCKQEHSRVITKNVCIRTNDTDVAIIFLGNMSKYAEQIDKLPVFFDRGTGDGRKMICVTDIYHELGEPLACSLPAFHAFTGTDFTASFAQKGKIRPYKILKKHPEILNAFQSLGNTSHIPQAVSKQLNRFTAMMYGEEAASVDDARFKRFMKIFSNGNLDKIKNVDAGNLPPCGRVLDKKLQRANYVAHVWKNADSPTSVTLSEFSPDKCGWKLLSNNSFGIDWFDGEQLPQMLTTEIAHENESNSTDDEEEVVLSESDEEEDDDY